MFDNIKNKNLQTILNQAMMMTNEKRELEEEREI